MTEITDKNSNMLENMSKADTDHDFSLSIEQKNVFKNGTYDDGLPKGTNTSSISEIQTLLSNIKEIELPNITSFNNITDSLNNQNTISTNFNSSDVKIGSYNVEKLVGIKKGGGGGQFTYTDYISKTKTSLTAKTFLEILKVENHAAFVVDAVAISVLDILKLGDNTRDNTIYYVMAPEITNDPAGKTSCKDILKLANISMGTNIVPIVEAGGGTSKRYTYSNSADASANSFNQFYTKYEFMLSSLKTSKGFTGKSYHYNDITITHPEFSENGKFKVTFSDSKKQNNINTLLSSLTRLIGKMLGIVNNSSKFKTNAVDIFNMNREFQQKRAGDWLQVLLCKNLMKRSMVKFATYNGPDGDLITNISEVWFVTHDIIALSFALYSGVNCLFTHGPTGSVYSFKIQNEEAALERQKDIGTVLQNKVVKYRELCNQLQNNITTYTTTRNTFLTTNFISKLTYDVTEKTWDSMNPITKLFNIISNKTVANEDTKIDDVIQTLFGYAYKYSHYAQLYPDLTDIKNDLEVISKTIQPDLLVSSATVSTDLASKNNTYQACFDKIDNYESIVSNYGDNRTAETGYTWTPYALSFDTKTVAGVRDGLNNPKNYTKFQIELQPSYKLIQKFAWSNVNFNLRRFLASFGNKDYKMDSCLFLYDMKNLDETMRIRIVDVFYKYDRHLDTLNDQDGVVIKDSTNVQVKKYYHVMKGFCQQVYMGIYEFENTDNIQSNVKDMIDAYNELLNNTSNIKDGDNIIFTHDAHMICDDNTVDCNNNYLDLVKNKQLFNDYNYGDIIGNDNNNNFTQQEIANFCGKDTDVINNTPLPGCNIDEDDVASKIIEQGNTISTQVGGALQQNYKLYTTISSDVKQVIYTQLGVFLTKIVDVNKIITIYTSFIGNGLGLELDNDNNINGSYKVITDIVYEDQSLSTSKQTGGTDMDNIQSEEVIASHNKFDSNFILPFQLYTLGFHPLLPIYVQLQGMYNVTFDHVDESLDYELLVRYFSFLQKLRTELESIYNVDAAHMRNEIAIRQLAAYIIGQAINLVINDLDMLSVNVNSKYAVDVSEEDGHSVNELYITKYLGMTQSQYMSISLLGKNLSYDVFGSSDIEISDSTSLIIQNSVVSKYLNKIDMKSIFYDEMTEPLPDINTFQERVYDYLISTGQQIVRDRRMSDSSLSDTPSTNNTVSSLSTPSSILSNVSSLSSESLNTSSTSSPSAKPCSTGKYKTLIKDGNIIKVCDEDARVLKPFNMKTVSMLDYRATETTKGDNDSVVTTSSSIGTSSNGNSGNRRRGGKPTKKRNKQNKPKKRTLRKNIKKKKRMTNKKVNSYRNKKHTSKKRKIK